MIDEKKIEKYAEDYAYHNCSEEESYAAYKAFIAGINWFLGNLWHDGKKKPEAFKYVLTETCEFHTGYKVLMFHGGDPWEKMVKFNNITRWLYIDDLMKGGKS